jgi:hypothetical protein
MGTIAVAGIIGLAPWDPSQSAAYRKVIDAASVSLGDSRTVRLEGVIPHLGPQGGVGYNKVRLFYVFNAVQGQLPDLVVIKIATHVAIPGTVQARQDGMAHGPPH